MFINTPILKVIKTLGLAIDEQVINTVEFVRSQMNTKRTEFN